MMVNIQNQGIWMELVSMWTQTITEKKILLVVFLIQQRWCLVHCVCLQAMCYTHHQQRQLKHSTTNGRGVQTCETPDSTKLS